MQLLTIKHFKSALSLGFFFKLTNIQNIAVNQNCHRITAVFLALQCLQCFDTVGWASGRAYGLKKLIDEVLVWLSLSAARCRLFAYGPADATASRNPIISCLI